MKKYIKLIVLTIFLLPTFVFGADKYKTTATAIEVNEHGICRMVKSNDGKQYLVPTKTLSEWNAFLNGTFVTPNSPIVISECSGTTPPSQPSQTTIITDNVTPSATGCVQMNGSINTNNSEQVLFKYGRSESNLNNIEIVGEISSTQIFSKQVCGLSSGNYYYQAQTQSNIKGEILSFQVGSSGNHQLPPGINCPAQVCLNPNIPGCIPQVWIVCD